MKCLAEGPVAKIAIRKTERKQIDLNKIAVARTLKQNWDKYVHNNVCISILLNIEAILMKKASFLFANYWTIYASLFLVTGTAQNQLEIYSFNKF